MSKKNRNGSNKQGVRDLNHLPSKPKGIRLEMPPDMQSAGCDHATTILDKDGDPSCRKCGIPLY
jgi:hypothetical protein